MSATFDSPLAATLLAVERLLFECKPRSFIPVVVVASFVRPVLLGDGPLFPVTAHSPHPTWQLALGCIACGLAAGAMSGRLTKGVYLFEDRFQKLPIHWMW